MSNKNQLLNHNERLASVIQTLQGKSVPGSGEGNNPTGGVITGTMVGTTTLVAPPGQNTYYYSLEEFADRFLVVLKPVNTDANSFHIIMCRQNITDEFEVYSSYPTTAATDTILLSISDHVLAITTSLSQYNQVTYIAA